MAHRLSIPLLLLATLAVLSGPARAGADALVLGNAWVRALPPTQPMTAAYLEVTNNGTAAVRIVGAEVAGAGRVELHESGGEGGMSRMRLVPEVLLAPGEIARFAPGGLHLMLMDLERMPAEGEERRLCLLTGDGGRACTDAPVRRSAAGGG